MKINGLEAETCPTCGHLRFVCNGQHIHTYLITIDCAKKGVRK